MLKTLCALPHLVKLAMDTQQLVAKTCCKDGENECEFNDGAGMCAYRRQYAHYLQSGTCPDVWIIASDLLFFTHKVFENVKGVIVDESFFRKGLDDEWEIALADLNCPQSVVQVDDPASMLQDFRHTLYQVLSRAQGDVVTANLFDLYEDCKRAIACEWREVERRVKELSMFPGMQKKHFARAVKKQDSIAAIQLARKMIVVWEEIRRLLPHQETEISGRLQVCGDRLICRGVSSIRAPFNQLPTLLPDAVLPDRKIIEVFYPSVVVLPQINARSSPHVDVQQILDAPTTKTKLKMQGNLEAIWRYIIQEWLFSGRKDTLVVCQKEIETRLRKMGLPENVFVEHYYNVAGKDGYKNVALGILVGRPAPSARIVEEIAGALFGTKPLSVLNDDLDIFDWYPSTDFGIRLLNGDGIKTTSDQHPDQLAEAVRWSLTEGELINAFGRLRAINRTADNPCVAKLLFNNCLPISVNAVKRWSEPCRSIETALIGWIAEHAVELQQLWPDRYKTLRAARWAMQGGIIHPPGFVPVSFQIAGSQKHRPGRVRVVYFDLNKIPDPRKWLQERLGKALIFPATKSGRAFDPEG